MRLLVVLGLVVVAAHAYPFVPVPGGGSSYYGQGGGREGGFGGSGFGSAGGAGGGVYDRSSTGFRRTEEGHDTRSFGANNNMNFVNGGGQGFGYDRAGGNMFGGGEFMGPMAG